MQTILVQVLCLVGLFFFMLLCCLAPIPMMRFQKEKQHRCHIVQIISISNCLAGGVFLSMCFLRLFPNVQEKFSAIKQFGIKFPVAESVVVIGFLFVLLLEQLILKYRQQNKGHLGDLEMDTLTSQESEDNLKTNDDSSEEIDLNQDSSLRNGFVSNHYGHNHGQSLIAQESGLRFIMLFLAIAIHSIFEGVALGLQKDTVTIINIFLGILIHEALVSLALGFNLCKLKLDCWGNIRFAILFCIMIPVGGAIGIAVGKTPGLVGDIISGVLQGLATGTFIYVTFFEIIPNEIEGNKNRLLKVLFLSLGFVLWAILNYITL